MVEQQRQKRLKGWRLVMFTAGVILIIVFTVIAALNKFEIFKGYWYDIISLFIGTFGFIITLFALLFPLSPFNETETTNAPDSTNTPAIPPPMPTSFTFSPSITVSPNITMNPQQGTLPTSPTQQFSSTQPTVSIKQVAEDGTPVATQTQTAPTLASPQSVVISPDAVFHPNTNLTDANEFYGRNSIRNTLLDRTRKGSSTAIVGERRIGKTWLVRYLMLTAPHDATLGSNYRVGYLDATGTYCHTIADFVMKALERLDISPTTPLQEKASLQTLEDAIAKRYQQQHITSVLCIDEFEGLGQHKEFDLDFLAGLRAMTQEGLVLVTVTRKPLMETVTSILGEQAKTSPFFNIFYSLTLKPFKPQDADAFTKAKSIQANFNEEERQRVLDCSVAYGAQGEKQWYPLKLQIAGHTLLADKQAAQDDPDCYLPHDMHYWIGFEQRAKEQYESVVKP